ncbi:MAG: hypothetical protein JSS19_06270 [Proteobacteria bacterium]|nr:hypothetical protein [Pseudomonadota bacterium]MBS0608940.1 hypothetical protein [Pseudomonadota bacterium]
MPLLHRLRQLAPALLGRLVLAWFALSLGAAIASPLVSPRAMELVCSSAGVMKVVVKSDDGVQELGASHLDCPMCMPLAAPPPVASRGAPPPSPLSHALRPVIAARIAAATAAPLPARGPPSL